MSLASILNWVSQTSQKIVGFLFASKWTIWIIGAIVVLYFIWLGMKSKENKENKLS